MAGQALYLKYRPRTFEEVVGQEPITRTLQNALRQGRIRHAYLFAGPRGTGKTTMARLLAKAVNCLAAEDNRPCNTCSICVAINEGRLLDLIEMDAASNRGIDEIRSIREKVGFRPSEARFKVYVLDEAHMLTEPAFNALLKTLEEPPPHVIFALVTTDPHKIPATIISRCQRFDFRRVPLSAIVDRLAAIAHQEGVKVEPAALELIARQSAGALRDAISLLDQLTSYGDVITLEQVQRVLGTVTTAVARQLAACLANGQVAAGLDLINRALDDGADPRQLGREVIEVLRVLLLIKQGVAASGFAIPVEQVAEMNALAERLPMERLLRAIHAFNAATTELKRGLPVIPQLPLEMALVESLLTVEAAATAFPGQAETPPPILSPQPVASSQAVESSAPARTIEQQVRKSEGAPSISEPPSAAQALSLREVERVWPQVLQAVRQRNPTTQAVLNTGCQPVEVNGNEIIVTFPFPFLRDKLGDPQRRMEIQEALSEVLRTRCRLRLVLASEYTPSSDLSSTYSEEQGANRGTLNDQTLGEIARWAQQRGGEATILSS
ncbi:MAG: DNA polymerase III subunit gamma/tau [Anaerolineae bacterium]